MLLFPWFKVKERVLPAVDASQKRGELNIPPAVLLVKGPLKKPNTLVMRVD